MVVQQLLSRTIIVERSTIIWGLNKHEWMGMWSRRSVSKSLHGIVPKYVHKVGKKGAVSCGEGIP